jgi:hypothetical protein
MVQIALYSPSREGFCYEPVAFMEPPEARALAETLLVCETNCLVWDGARERFLGSPSEKQDRAMRAAMGERGVA